MQDGKGNAERRMTAGPRPHPQTNGRGRTNGRTAGVENAERVFRGIHPQPTFCVHNSVNPRTLGAIRATNNQKHRSP